ncbi:carbohydrate-binding protein [Micromonospora krabiensis]|uniref:carbohydrate-binding protein n=1 Tax=Micromonospora krabiensis TaxID=307121 RepID=UPI0018D454E9|nr:carbohydrate-binding protein [Micromonospora krabiensis]
MGRRQRLGGPGRLPQREVEIRLDSASGPVVGTCVVGGTGGWQTWTTSSCGVSGATGTHELYLRFTGGSGILFNVNSWQFSGGAAATAYRIVNRNTDGYHQQVNANSGKCLNVAGGSTVAGAALEQRTCTAAISMQ